MTLFCIRRYFQFLKAKEEILLLEIKGSNPPINKTILISKTFFLNKNVTV